MRAIEFLLENKVTLQNLYGGNFPDRDETFWDYVRPGELNNPLDIKTLPKYKLAIMLQGQYRVEHLDEILDMMEEDQKEILQRYIDDPNLSKKTIVISGDRIIDGNHRALAAAMKGVPINYVDLVDLDEQDVTEGFDKEAGAWRDWQLKMLPRKIEMLSRLVKGWVPSEEDHIAAIEAGYDAMKETGDVKDAAKAIADTLKEIQRRQGVAEDIVDEMALSTYKTMGDFSKPGPFTGADKKLVPHPKNIEKATRFFEQTPFDFRLFFSHLKGTGKYSEHGPMSPDQIRQVFGQDAEEIINGSEDAITVVYVGNKGDSKVMLTPWIMAHRFGHSIQAGVRKNSGWSAWSEAENHFFSTVNNILEEYYGKAYRGANTYRTNIKWDMTPEYNALFNAIGTQRSSRTGQIRRPYEFLYEAFAQYLGTGKITFNPLPTNLTYGRKVFGNPTKYMNIKPEFRDEGERQQAAEILARDMELMFDDVLSSSVGKIFVM